MSAPLSLTSIRMCSPPHSPFGTAFVGTAGPDCREREAAIWPAQDRPTHTVISATVTNRIRSFCPKIVRVTTTKLLNASDAIRIPQVFRTAISKLECQSDANLGSEGDSYGSAGTEEVSQGTLGDL